MHHVFDVEDSAALNALIWTELRKRGIKETGRCRKPTRNNNNNDSQKRNLFGQPLELLESEEALVMVESELDERSADGKAFVRAKGDILVRVPTFVVQACQAILRGVGTEGLFRKAGSAARQREIKRQLERGEGVKPSHDVIDLANILKQFLRELSEPLIPYQLHEMLLKCIQLENSDKVFRAIHLVCLLIPQRALATLCYLLQFFEAVAANSSRNLMDAANLSIVMAPTLIPVHIPATSRTDRQGCSKLQLSARVIQILIENGNKLGGLPQCIVGRLVSISTTSLTLDGVQQQHELRGRRSSRCDKKRHRRSSSFNRVFEGLRKIVGVRMEWSASVEQLSDCPSESLITDQAQPEPPPPQAPPPPPPPPLPSANSPVTTRRASLKRKVADSDTTNVNGNTGLSMKKKKAGAEIPVVGGRVLCTTPLTPQGNHRYAGLQSDVHHSYFASPRIDLNPSPSGPAGHVETNKSTVGVLRFFHRKKGAGKNEDGNGAALAGKTPSRFTKRRLSLGKKTSKKLLNDAIKPAGSDREEPSNAISKVPIPTEVQEQPEQTKEDAARRERRDEETYNVVRQHYDHLKCHVAALEKEVGSLSPDEKDAVFERSTTARMSLPLQVQGQYERTLEESQKLLLERSASDQLARQLSRGLRIRRSGEQRVVRSPSARKIGAVRRRSREASPRHSLVDSNGSGNSSRRLTRSQSMLAIRRNPSQVLRAFQQQQLQVMVTPKRLMAADSPCGGQQPPDSTVKVSLRRGKPNTIRTGLKEPTPMRAVHSERPGGQNPGNGNSSPVTSAVASETPRVGKPRVLAYPTERDRGEDVPPVHVSSRRRSSGQHCTPTMGQKGSPSTRTPPSRIPSASKRPINRNGSVMKLAQNFVTIGQAKEAKEVKTALLAPLPVTPVFTTPEAGGQPDLEQIQWTSGETLLNNRQLDHLRIPLTGRPSVQKIRSENLGKVSAHVRKFDRLASPTAQTTGETLFSFPPEATPHRPVASAITTSTSALVQRRLSSAVAEAANTTPAQISPLRESQRANALPGSSIRLAVSNELRLDPKIKAPLLTPSAGTVTPFGFKLRNGHEASASRQHVRLQKKPSPMRAHQTAAVVRRSPRFVNTPH